MNTILINTVFFLGLLTCSTSSAQSGHQSVVGSHLQKTVVNSPLSDSEKQSLISYLEDVKWTYVEAMQQAEMRLDQILEGASADLKAHVKHLYFKSDLLKIIGLEFLGRHSVLEYEKENFDKTIALVQKNSGSIRDLKEIQMRLDIIEKRQKIVFQSIDEILQDNIYLYA